MVKTVSVDVDFNGIIIFDYPGILTLFDGHIDDDANILQAFTTTEKGDIALEKGITLPIMGIDDGEYTVRLFLDEQPNEEGRKVIFTDKYFYLHVTGDLYIADMSTFWEWETYTGWHNSGIPKGMYKVCLQGVQLQNSASLQNIDEVDYCYDLILEKVTTMGTRDIEPRSDSRVY